MAEYINQEALAADGWYLQRHIYRESTVCVENMNLLDAPTVDVVSKGAYDQCDWERIVALTQLKEIGKGLGERMDDVRPVVRGEWDKHEDYDEYGGGRYVEWSCSECCHIVKRGWAVRDKNIDKKPTENFCSNCGALMYNKE